MSTTIATAAPAASSSPATQSTANIDLSETRAVPVPRKTKNASVALPNTAVANGPTAADTVATAKNIAKKKAPTPRGQSAPTKKAIAPARKATGKLPAKPMPKPQSKPVSKPASKPVARPAQTPKPAAVVQAPPAEKTRQSVARKPEIQKARPVVPVTTKAKAPTVKPADAKKPDAVQESSDKASIKTSAKSSTKAVKPLNARKVSEKTSAQKDKLVRDSFTMPQDDYALIARLKDRAVMFKRPAKKSELLRAGLHALQAMSAPALRAALDALTPLKSGRPKKALV